MHQETIALPFPLADNTDKAGDSAKASILDYDKGELHVHLNGAVPTETILEILADEEIALPPNFDPEQDLIHQSPCTSLAEYLAPWQLLRKLPRREKNLQRLVNSAIAELHRNGIRFVELRSSVLYLATIQECSVLEALHRLTTCIDLATKPYAIQWGLILTISRGDHSSSHLTTLLIAYEALGRPQCIIGIDLAGDEDIPYPPELPMLFRKAKDQYDLGITIHAGETGRSENIRTAIELFHADRIGHGTAAGNDPSLMELLSKRDICVEVCPISNRLTGAVSSEKSHPLRRFHEHGVPFVICADNPSLHGKGLNQDYLAALEEGLSRETIKEQYEQAKRYSFIKEIK